MRIKIISHGSPDQCFLILIFRSAWSSSQKFSDIYLNKALSKKKTFALTNRYVQHLGRVNWQQLNLTLVLWEWLWYYKKSLNDTSSDTGLPHLSDSFHVEGKALRKVWMSLVLQELDLPGSTFECMWSLSTTLVVSKLYCWAWRNGRWFKYFAVLKPNTMFEFSLFYRLKQRIAVH